MSSDRKQPLIVHAVSDPLPLKTLLTVDKGAGRRRRAVNGPKPEGRRGQALRRLSPLAGLGPAVGPARRTPALRSLQEVQHGLFVHHLSPWPFFLPLALLERLGEA